MFRRIVLIAAMVGAAGALVGATPAAAAYPWAVKVQIDTCSFTGGAHGHGYMEFQIKSKEFGRSGTTQIVVHSWRQESSGLAFSNQQQFVVDKSAVFPNDSTNYYHVSFWHYDFTKNDELTNRIQAKVAFKSSTGKTLTTITVNSSNC